MGFNSITIKYGLFDYIRLPVITALGWYLYNEKITTNIIIGSTLIIAAALTTLKTKQK